MRQIYFVPNRCVGCEECVEACSKAHGWESRAFVEVVDGYFPYPIRCNHCEDAPCKSACPVEAIHRTATGAVVVNPDKCIGCGTCVIVCPFGVPRVSARTHKVVKCDLCDDLIQRNEKPTCVAACPKEALVFDDYGQPLQARRLRLAAAIKGAIAP